MTRFIGGPYDGRDLPIDPPFAKVIRLPREDELDAFLGEGGDDPGSTASFDWPYVYEFDTGFIMPQYRFVKSDVS